MELTSKQMVEVVDYLQGTCLSIDNALYELFDLEGPEDLSNEMEVLHYVDDQLFLCPVCKWWTEAGDREYCGKHREDVCNECAENY